MKTRLLIRFAILVCLPAAMAHAGYTRNIMLTGYWPPTNDMLRPFNTDPVQNPEGWMGGNWEGRGYDVFSFFPEFPDWPNDRKGVGDFEVDYQDTSADFWRITSELNPVAMITFSQTQAPRRAWEVELRQRNLEAWGDDFAEPFQPTPAPPDDSVPAGHVRYSSLPAYEIAAAVQEAGIRVNAFVDEKDFGGGFVSEFIAYHGTWYHDLHADPDDPYRNVAAGHIHVGNRVGPDAAREATDVTLRALIRHVDQVLAVPEPAGAVMWVVGSLWLWSSRRGRVAERSCTAIGHYASRGGGEMY